MLQIIHPPNFNSTLPPVSHGRGLIAISGRFRSHHLLVAPAFSPTFPHLHMPSSRQVVVCSACQPYEHTDTHERKKSHKSLTNWVTGYGADASYGKKIHTMSKCFADFFPPLLPFRTIYEISTLIRSLDKAKKKQIYRSHRLCEIVLPGLGRTDRAGAPWPWTARWKYGG